MPEKCKQKFNSETSFSLFFFPPFPANVYPGLINPLFVSLGGGLILVANHQFLNRQGGFINPGLILHVFGWVDPRASPIDSRPRQVGSTLILKIKFKGPSACWRCNSGAPTSKSWVKTRAVFLHGFLWENKYTNRWICDVSEVIYVIGCNWGMPKPLVHSRSIIFHYCLQRSRF